MIDGYIFNIISWKIKTKMKGGYNMYKEKFEKITMSDAESIIENIWNAMKPSDEGIEKKFVDTFEKIKLYKIIMCYFVWKLKKDNSIKTWEDLDYAYHKKNFETSMFMANDLCEDYFSYYQEEWEKLCALKDKYSEEELAACILKTNHFEKNFYELAPNSIERLVNSFLQISAEDKVCEINSGVNEYIINSYENYKETEFIAISEDMSALLSQFIKSDVKGYGDKVRFIGLEYEENDATKVFVNSCIDKPQANYVGFSPRDAYIYLAQFWKEYPAKFDSEWVLCATGIAMTNFKGRVIAVMNGGELTQKQGEEHRKFLCEKGWIEGVIALPDKMYQDTWVNTFLVILSNGNKKVKFLDARDMYTKSRIGGKRINDFTDSIIASIKKKYEDDSEITKISLEEIALTDYNLNPLRYVINRKSKVEMVELGNFINEIKRGITLTAAEMDKFISDEESDIPCIKTSQITSGIVENFNYYHGELNKKRNNSAYHKNVLISKVGTPFKIALADRDYLVIGNLYILAIDSMKISPEYVKCYLSSECGQKELERLAVGSSSPRLNIADVSKIRIPVYESQKQIEMEERAMEIVNEMETIHHQMEEYKKEEAVMFN